MVQSVAVDPIESSFAEVIGLIELARQRAYQAVNTETPLFHFETEDGAIAMANATVFGIAA